MANPVITQLEQESTFIEHQLAARKLAMKKTGWLVPTSCTLVYLLTLNAESGFRLKVMFFAMACFAVFGLWHGIRSARQAIRRKQIQSELSRLRLAQHVAGENTDFQSTI
jgi:hypothetical protein